MDFELTSEQRDLESVVAKVGAQRSDLDEMAADSIGYLDRSWAEVSEQIGLHALLISEEHEGLSGTVLDACVAAEQLGSDLYAPAFLIAGVVAPVLMSACRGDSLDGLLKEVASGTRRVVASEVPHPGESLSLVQLSPDRVRATGTVKSILALPESDRVVVPALIGGECGLIIIEVDRHGVTRSDGQATDLGRPVMDLHLEKVDCEWHVADPVRYQRAWDTISVVLASELCGTARASLNQSVAYSRDRIQFGAPIGSFQAIKHLAADMVSALEGAQACARAAASFIDNDSEEATESAAAALFAARQAAYRCAASSLQIHGAISYTWEHSAHHHYRRALTGRVALVSPEDVISALVPTVSGAQ